MIPQKGIAKNPIMKGTEKKTAHPTQDKGIKTDPTSKREGTNIQRPEETRKTKTPSPPPFGDPQRNTPDKWQDETTTKDRNHRRDEDEVDDIEQEEESIETGEGEESTDLGEEE